MIPKSCRLFGQDHATKQVIRAKWRFDLIPFRSKAAEFFLQHRVMSRAEYGACRPSRVDNNQRASADTLKARSIPENPRLPQRRLTGAASLGTDLRRREFITLVGGTAAARSADGALRAYLPRSIDWASLTFDLGMDGRE